jgi:hypothetical protein
MSIPTAVFLDTSVFDGQQYNFHSTALATFVPACAKRSLTLLLPDPTEREIRRHLLERVAEALSIIEGARRKAPFLSKLKGFAREFNSPEIEAMEAERLANLEWNAFLKQFSVVRLGYKDLDVEKVMRWYDRIEAPFKEGKKRKEFPDAFAIQMLDAHAQQENLYIAVVSGDQDIKHACQRYSGLLYFQTLPRLTELLLSDDARIENLRLVIQRNESLIEAAIFEELPAVDFHHRSDRFEVHGYDSVEFEGVDASIVAIGDGECTVAFDTVQAMEFDLRWEDDTEDGIRTFRRDVKERVELSGTAKISFSEGGNEVSEVSLLMFDQRSVQLSETPYGMWW